MAAMRPEPGWMGRLPRGRLLAEMSLWSADLLRLAHDLDRIGPWADILHADAADGHFAPALLLFPDLVAQVRARTARPIHVHLMVADAALLSQVDQFAEAGADLISVHAENADAGEALERVRSHGLAAGLVLRVETPVAEAAPFVGAIDALTLLGTAIGVKGQGLDPRACDRLEEAGRLIGGRDVLLCADGGIREGTVPQLRAAGARTVVMGSLAFGAPDLDARMGWLRGL